MFGNTFKRKTSFALTKQAPSDGLFCCFKSYKVYYCTYVPTSCGSDRSITPHKNSYYSISSLYYLVCRYVQAPRLASQWCSTYRQRPCKISKRHPSFHRFCTTGYTIQHDIVISVLSHRQEHFSSSLSTSTTSTTYVAILCFVVVAMHESGDFRIA